MTTTSDQRLPTMQETTSATRHRLGLSRDFGGIHKGLALLVLSTLPASAFAYIDPNAGGMLFQILMPVFAAIAGAWLFLRRWIAACFIRLWEKLTKPGSK
jgi:hypothetical protein